METPSLIGEHYLRSLIDAFPAPVFIVDENLVIHDANRASATLFKGDPDAAIQRLCGDSIRCVRASEAPEGCGKTPWCSQCIVRQSTKKVLQGGTAYKELTTMTLLRDGRPKDIHYLVTAAPFDYAGRRYVLLTFEDVTELSILRRIVPMCSFCRKVRDDENYWQQVEAYFQKYTDLRFSHGLCPECREKHYADKL